MNGGTVKSSRGELFCCVTPAEEGATPFPEPTADTMLEFRLKVKCKRNPKAPKGSEDPNELYLHSNGERQKGDKPITFISGVSSALFSDNC